VQRAQFVDDRDVAAGVPEPDRRGHHERATAPAQRPAPPARRLRRGRQPFDELPDQQVAAHRVAERRQVAAALERDEPDAQQLGQRHTVRVRDDPVFVAVHHEHRAAHRPAHVLERLLGDALPGGDGEREHLGRRLQAPADRVLDRLRAVRLGDRLPHEVLHERAVVRQATLGAERGDAARRADVVERARPRLDRGHVGRHAADRHDGPHPLRVPRRGLQPVERAHRRACEHRLVHPDGVQHGDRVGDDLAVGVPLGLRGPVGPPVAPRVVGDHPHVPREIGRLKLPLPRMQDLPGRKKDDRRPGGSEHLVADPHPVALDVAHPVRLACTHFCLLG